MFFTKNQIHQTVKYPFNWVADYLDGTFLTEFDLKSHRPNDFYNIEQSKVYRFGLFGNNMKFFFETVDGHFHLNGRRLDICYELKDGTKINLTNNQSKKDLITYKQAFTEFNSNITEQKTNIESINFGYKTAFNDKDIQIFFQPIVSLPFGKSTYIEIKLTSSKDLNGYLVFYIRGKERERFHAPLEANISGQLNWTIK